MTIPDPPRTPNPLRGGPIRRRPGAKTIPAWDAAQSPGQPRRAANPYPFGTMSLGRSSGAKRVPSPSQRSPTTDANTSRVPFTEHSPTDNHLRRLAPLSALRSPAFDNLSTLGDEAHTTDQFVLESPTDNILRRRMPPPALPSPAHENTSTTHNEEKIANQYAADSPTDNILRRRMLPPALRSPAIDNHSALGHLAQTTNQLASPYAVSNPPTGATRVDTIRANTTRAVQIGAFKRGNPPTHINMPPNPFVQVPTQSSLVSVPSQNIAGLSSAIGSSSASNRKRSVSQAFQNSAGEADGSSGEPQGAGVSVTPVRDSGSEGRAVSDQGTSEQSETPCATTEVAESTRSARYRARRGTTTEDLQPTPRTARLRPLRATTMVNGFPCTTDSRTGAQVASTFKKYSVSPQLHGIRKALGEQDWALYVELVEQMLDGSMTEAELAPKEGSIFQTFNAGMRRQIRAMMVKMVASVESSEES